MREDWLSPAPWRHSFAADRASLLMSLLSSGPSLSVAPWSCPVRAARRRLLAAATAAVTAAGSSALGCGAPITRSGGLKGAFALQTQEQ